MGRIPKKVREEVYQKCDGHCGYCGKEIEYKQMQVDHIIPKWHNMSESTADRVGIEKGTDDIDNLMPSCARCNKWKSTFSVETFRSQISKQLMRLERDSSNYRLARDFGLLEEKDINVVFYFEK